MLKSVDEIIAASRMVNCFVYTQKTGQVALCEIKDLGITLALHSALCWAYPDLANQVVAYRR